MKEIKQTIETKSAIDLNIQVSMEGNTIIKRQSDSLVGNFLRGLYTMMGDLVSDTEGRRVIFDETSETDLDTSANVDFTSNARVEPGDNNVFIDSSRNENLVYLDTPTEVGISGFYYAEPDGGSDREFDVYEITVDRATGSFNQGSRTDWSGIDDSNFDGRIYIKAFSFREEGRDEDILGNPQIIVGRNKPNTSASVEDYWLENEIPYFDTTGTTISEPAVQTNSSTITLSRQFTNNTGSDIDVGEIGVYTDNQNQDHMLIARDSVSTFTIAAGNSVTLEYEININSTSDGGMMSQFQQILYRQLQRTDRNVRDINNNDRSNSNEETQFMPVSFGGNVDQRFYDTNYRVEVSSVVGPVVGTGTDSVANTNFSLSSQVPFGSGDGELFYYGAVVEQIVVDEANDEIYFDVIKPLENRGSTTITINEQALYNAFYDPADVYPSYSSMIARHVLSNSVDVSPGEILKAGYRMKLVV